MSQSSVRQGDVLLVPVSRPIGGVREIQRGLVTLALGKSTGHSHTIQSDGVALFETDDGRRLVWCEEPATVRHEEHDFFAATGRDTVLSRGWYEVVEQMEEDSLAGIRRVVD